MGAIDNLDIRQQSIIDEISDGKITNDNLDLLYKIIILKGQIKENNNTRISNLYTGYINARKLYIIDKTEQNKDNIIKSLCALLEKVNNMLSDIWDSSLIEEEREALTQFNVIHK